MTFAADQPLVDHHCHGVLLQDLDQPRFEGLMSEAPRAAPGTSPFDSMIGLAVRRWCPPVLDLPPLTLPDAYLARRLEVGHEEVARRFLRATGTATYLVDTGYQPEAISSPEQLGDLAGAEAREVVRLERLCEDLLVNGVAPAAVPEQIRQALHTTRAIAAKSIAAYRTGLALPGAPPTEQDMVQALCALRFDPGQSLRLANPIIHGWLAWAAIEAGLPLQFHVGYGDRDLDLPEADPLLLTPFLRSTEDHGVPVLLLHNYPFHRHASYLAQVFTHVYMDVGLATHNAGALSVAVVRESLELVPFAKMLYSSDAFALPELYHLGAHLFRRALRGVLDDLVASGDATSADADRISRLILHDNACRAYGLVPADAP